MSNVNSRKYGILNGSGGLQVFAPVNNATFPISQGDLVYWDAGASIAKRVGVDANAATLLGVALQPSAVSSNIDLSSAPAEKGIMCEALAVHSFKTTAAETLNHGEKVYIGADAQTVTTVAGSNAVGIVQLPPNVTSVTGAAGVNVDVLVYHKAFLPLQG